MHRFPVLAALLLLLAACGAGQPFFDEPVATCDVTVDPDCVPTVTPDPDPESDGSFTGTLPPGTDEPQANRSILRYEAEDGQGGGYVQNVQYNEGNDTFYVDNLAFDGANVYDRGDPVAQMGGYAVFDAVEIVRDPQTNKEIGQFDYHAIYGASSETVTVNGQIVPRTQFAIVRTGSYAGYGFGGFIYQRNGSVNLPTGGQARWDGSYAGMRVFNGTGGIQYTRADMVVAIDFEDFNQGNGVYGRIYDREFFHEDGSPVILGTTSDGDQPIAPDLLFEVGPGAMTDNGEISAGIHSSAPDSSGVVSEFETGTYYAVVAGDNADEIVGVIVIEATEPGQQGATVQETGGFILAR